MDDRCDFPAAHSMDTAWFAVDRDGHVAVFESGEGGAAPSKAYLGEGHWELLELLQKKLPRTGVVHQLASSLEDEEAFAPAEHGLYAYHHLDDEAFAAPYVPLAAPSAPITIDDLPPEVAAKAIVFDGRFAEGPPVQPAALWVSESWGPAWLSLDGKTVHPFPGREDEVDDIEEELFEEQGFALGEVLTDLPEGELFVPKPRAAPPGEELEKKAQNGVPPAVPEKKPWWKLW